MLHCNDVRDTWKAYVITSVAYSTDVSYVSFTGVLSPAESANSNEHAHNDFLTYYNNKGVQTSEEKV